MGCGGSGNNFSEPDEDNPVILVSGFLGKQHYVAGERFTTTGDKLFVQYADKTYGTITSGFTQEWAKNNSSEYESVSAWSADDSAWAPIRHGDPLPIPPPKLYQTSFCVRPVYKGMKGTVRWIWIYKDKNALPK